MMTGTPPPPPPPPPVMPAAAAGPGPLPPPGGSATPVFMAPPPQAPPSPSGGQSWMPVVVAVVAALVLGVGSIWLLAGDDGADPGVAESSVPSVADTTAGEPAGDEPAGDEPAGDEPAGDEAADEAGAGVEGEPSGDGPIAADDGSPAESSGNPDDVDVDPVPADQPANDESGDPIIGSGDDGGAEAEVAGDVDGSGVDAGDVVDDADAAQGDAGDVADDADAAQGDAGDVADDADAAPGDVEPSADAVDAGVDGADAGADDVPESVAVIRQGQIYLEGAVPSEEAAAEIEALAAEILGPDNVFNNYVIDPRAGDPSLGNITVEDTIKFATASARLLPESEPLLNQGLALMTIRPAVTIEIVGHTDDRGSEQYNLELSLQRAEAVKQWFVDREIDPERLITRGAGESEPIADNSTAEGQRLNRRIQFFLQNILGDV